jgi:hypothetical protein
MKEAPGSSETSVLTRATRRNNPEDTILLLDWIPPFPYGLPPGHYMSYFAQQELLHLLQPSSHFHHAANNIR